jgi:hypothetical protein
LTGKSILEKETRQNSIRAGNFEEALQLCKATLKVGLGICQRKDRQEIPESFRAGLIFKKSEGIRGVKIVFCLKLNNEEILAPPIFSDFMALKLAFNA